MDEISIFSTPAFGTSVLVSGTPGPYIVEGKHGGAIYMPNTGPYDDNYLDLGPHTDQCADNLTICDNGWTLAFWYELDTIPLSNYPCVVSATFFTVMNEKLATGARLYANFLLHKTPTEVSANKLLPFNNWYHIAYTYNGQGVKVYINGCEQEATVTVLPTTAMMGVSKVLQLGCQGTSYCGTWPYDDFYIWYSVKSPWFIWRLAH